MGFTLTPGLHEEQLDDEWLVLVPGRNDVAHLRGAEAEAFAHARRGPETVPAHLAAAMSGLVELGSDRHRGPPQRRRRILVQHPGCDLPGRRRRRRLEPGT